LQGSKAPIGQVGENRFRGTILAGLLVPLPTDYVQGFDSQKYDEEIGLARRVDGKLVMRGQWYSPLQTLLFKLPLGTLALLAAMAVYLVARIARRRRVELGELAALIPAAYLLALLATQTGLNWAFRYTLPALPFFFVGAGAVIRAALTSRVGRVFVALCIAWDTAVVLRARPSFLAYGNEIVGGFDGARREFLGSNLDWGQDLLRLKAWQNAHPEIGPIAITYYGVSNPGNIGLEVRGLPATFLRAEASTFDESEDLKPESFYWAISSSVLNGLPGPIIVGEDLTVNAAIRCQRLNWDKAAYNVGNSIFIFKVVANSSQAGREPSVTFDDLRGCIVPLDERQRVVSP